MKEKIILVDNLPFIQISISHQGKTKIIDNVLIDTGSGSTILKVDLLEDIGIMPEDEDIIATISGVGGSEFVFIKVIDCIQVGDLKVTDFKIDLGIMDYGFDINGIIGMDFLTRIFSHIDLEDFFLLGREQ